MSNGVVPLPKDKAALIAQRKVMRTRTLNDYVDDIHVKLWGESSVYMRFLDAVEDAGTVEGSTAIEMSRLPSVSGIMLGIMTSRMLPTSGSSHSFMR